MKKQRFATLALAALMTSGVWTAGALAQGPPQGYGQGPYGQAPYGGGGWDAPPRNFRAMEQQGFRDGIDGAQKDFGNHRRQNVNNRDEYRKPPVSPRDASAYRRGFLRGYRVGWDHIMNGDPRGGPRGGFFGR